LQRANEATNARRCAGACGCGTGYRERGERAPATAGEGVPKEGSLAPRCAIGGQPLRVGSGGGREHRRRDERRWRRTRRAVDGQKGPVWDGKMTPTRRSSPRAHPCWRTHARCVRAPTVRWGAVRARTRTHASRSWWGAQRRRAQRAHEARTSGTARPVGPLLYHMSREGPGGGHVRAASPPLRAQRGPVRTHTHLARGVAPRVFRQTTRVHWVVALWTRLNTSVCGRHGFFFLSLVGGGPSGDPALALDQCRESNGQSMASRPDTEALLGGVLLRAPLSGCLGGVIHTTRSGFLSHDVHNS